MSDTEIAYIDGVKQRVLVVKVPVSGDFVLKERGKSLVQDSKIAQIHESGSDNQDLSGFPVFTILTVNGDKATGANTTPVTLGISFDYEANKTYVIDIYAMVTPGAAGTGCGFMIDVSSGVNYVGSFNINQLAATGTVSGGSSIGDRGATSQGVSSGMVGTGSNFVMGSAILITGANAGTATIYFRSETTAVTTCKSGSVVRVQKVN